MSHYVDCVCGVYQHLNAVGGYSGSYAAAGALGALGLCAVVVVPGFPALAYRRLVAASADGLFKRLPCEALALGMAVGIPAHAY